MFLRVTEVTYIMPSPLQRGEEISTREVDSWQCLLQDLLVISLLLKIQKATICGLARPFV